MENEIGFPPGMPPGPIPSMPPGMAPGRSEEMMKWQAAMSAYHRHHQKNGGPPGPSGGPPGGPPPGFLPFPPGHPYWQQGPPGFPPPGFGLPPPGFPYGPPFVNGPPRPGMRPPHLDIMGPPPGSSPGRPPPAALHELQEREREAMAEKMERNHKERSPLRRAPSSQQMEPGRQPAPRNMPHPRSPHDPRSIEYRGGARPEDMPMHPSEMHHPLSMRYQEEYPHEGHRRPNAPSPPPGWIYDPRDRMRGGSSPPGPAANGQEHEDGSQGERQVSNDSGNGNQDLSDEGEREAKRQRRKQSNRESARRSRLRKQAECEELSGRIDSLQHNNQRLKDILLDLRKSKDRLSVECRNLEDEARERYGCL